MSIASDSLYGHGILVPQDCHLLCSEQATLAAQLARKQPLPHIPDANMAILHEDAARFGFPMTTTSLKTNAVQR